MVDIIKAVRGQIKKCLVLDLDNTVWGGVIGDDGMENIEIGELGLGHAFDALQQWAKELKNRGIILAVCSKNDEDKARQPFKEHPDMTLPWRTSPFRGQLGKQGRQHCAHSKSPQHWI